MKITDLRVYVVNAYRTNWVFVKISTDEGLTGVGEATLEHKEKTVEAALYELKRYLVGQNPLHIEAHFQRMYRDSYWRMGPVLMSAISAVEMSLWDICGKFYNAPVHQLLGGKCNDRIKAYANGWYVGAVSPAEFAAKAVLAVRRGFKALKWDPFGRAYMNLTHRELDFALESIGRVRDAVGSEIDILVEGHGRFNLPTSIRIAREIEPFKPLWFEEPLPPENVDALAEVRAKSPVPIAAGERIYTKFGFRELLEKRPLILPSRI